MKDMRLYSSALITTLASISILSGQEARPQEVRPKDVREIGKAGSSALPRLQELLKITRLDRILTIKPTQKEAIKVVF